MTKETNSTVSKNTFQSKFPHKDLIGFTHRNETNKTTNPAEKTSFKPLYTERIVKEFVKDANEKMKIKSFIEKENCD